MKKSIKTLLIYSVLIFVIIFACVLLLGQGDSEKPVYSDIIDYFEQGKVEEYFLSEKGVLVITLKEQYVVDGVDTIKYQLRNDDVTVEKFFADIKPYEEEYGIKSEIEPITSVPWFVSLLPYVIIIVLFIVLWVYFINKTTGKDGKITSFGRAKVKLGSNEKNRVYFTDVAGADEEKEELREIVEFLRDPAKFHKLGAKIPHGVLLVGPPGTGKTLLAKAVAGEAGVPFYSISGSDFVEMYVGVGASRVRDLFDTARKNPASIIFIDEIDAVGRHRGAGLGGGHDEREQTLNQLLVEMDGFGKHEGVIVIAATNRPDILDPALLRPGRFDRQVTVNYPDIKGREEILKVHAKNKPFENDVDLSKVAKITVGFTGADLANLLNEAALLAAKKSKHLIGMNDIEEAVIKIIVGTSKKSQKRTEKDLKITAFHEAGHAVVMHFLETQDPVQQISIIPTATANGYTLSSPVQDKFHKSKLEMFEEIVSLLGGRVAEEIVFEDITTGASNDIQRATSIARNMIMRYGMSTELGPIVYGSEHTDGEVFLGRDFSNTKNYSEETAFIIDKEIKRIVTETYEKAKEIINTHRDKLNFVAEFLISHEIMDQEQFEFAMNNENPTFEDLEKLVEEKRKKSEEENRIRAENEEKARQKDEEARKMREEQEKNGGNNGNQGNGMSRFDQAYSRGFERNFPPIDNEPTDNEPHNNDSDDSENK